MNNSTLIYLIVLCLLLLVVISADEYEEVPFLNPGKRSFNRVILRPIDFIQHKRMVGFRDVHDQIPYVYAIRGRRL